jgi:hypothetical protein
MMIILILLKKKVVVIDCQADWKDDYVIRIVEVKLRMIKINIKTLFVNRNNYIITEVSISFAFSDDELILFKFLYCVVWFLAFGIKTFEHHGGGTEDTIDEGALL